MILIGVQNTVDALGDDENGCASYLFIQGILNLYLGL